MPLSSNFITGGLGPGTNLVLGGLGGTLFQEIVVQKVRGTRYGPPGYWGRTIHHRILCEETIQKTRALMQDHIQAGGLIADLWLPVYSPITGKKLVGITDHMPGPIECSCFKKTTQMSDRKCRSCYGQRLIPGYKKFGFRTYFMASVDKTLTLTNLVLDNTFTPNRLRLRDDQLTGQTVSVDYPFSHDNSDGSTWLSEDVAIVEDSVHASLLTEFSTDSGSTWNRLDRIGHINPNGRGRIRFRVTLTRESLKVASPMFEILRARHPVIEESSDGRIGPHILILRSVTANQPQNKVHGIVVERSGIRYWTVPLGFFDPTIPLYSKDEILKRNTFIEIREGQDNEIRFPILDWSASDPLGFATRQFFGARMAQENEFLSFVF